MLSASSAQMKMLGKITDCESLEISQENFYDEVSLSKVKTYSVQTLTLL